MDEDLPTKNKRLKITDFQSLDKGKRKISELGEISEERNCGICFGEESRLIRGFIDCCNHYFCFLCIMEWAKIESRCPLCKQRFGSILRPVVPGVFSRERRVYIPTRDQAQPLNDATGEDDPYANTSCTICHSSEDEHLLLLCDLCDSSAHTYCTGNGFTVPEGDWYCADCAISRREQCKMRDGELHSPKIETEAEKSVSILEIVSDEASSKTQNLLRTERDKSASGVRALGLIGTGARTLHRQRDRHLHVQMLRENWSNLQSGSMGFSPISNPQSSQRFSQSSLASDGSYDIDRAWKMMELAKTAKNARPRSKLSVPPNKRLSGNQSAVESGASIKVDQPSGFLAKQFSSQRKGKHLIALCSSHSETQSRSMRLNEVPGCSPSQNSSLTNGESLTVEPGRSVSRASMTAQAVSKLKYPPNERLSGNQSKVESGASIKVDDSSGFLEKKLSSQRKVEHLTDLCSSHSETRSRSMRLNQAPGSSPSQDSSLTNGGSLPAEQGRSVSRASTMSSANAEVAKAAQPMTKLSVLQNERFLRNQSAVESGTNINHYFEFLGEKLSSQNRGRHLTDHCSSHSEILSRSMRPDQVSGCSPSQDSSLTDSESLPVEQGRSINRASATSSEDAKAEIQSLVKTYLKSKGGHIGKVKFKEIARISTHTVLAACGLDHSGPASRPIYAPPCHHLDNSPFQSKMVLLPGSCRQCFYTFVSHVVDVITSERTSASVDIS